MSNNSFRIQELGSDARRVFRVAVVVQAAMGFTMGLYIYTFGPLFYEKLSSLMSATYAMTLTSFLIVIDHGLVAALEVPTGALGDSVGRKKTVVWSWFCRTFYFLLLAFIPFIETLPLLLIAGFCALLAFNIGYTLFSGSFTAWCVDKLNELAPTVGCEHVLSRAYGYNFASQLVGGLLAVSLYLWNKPQFAYLLGAIVCVSCMIFCIGEMEDERRLLFVGNLNLAAVSKRAGEILGVGYQIFRRSRMILTLVCIYAAYMCVVNVTDYLWPVYLRSLVVPELQSPYWCGMVVATMGMCAIGSKLFLALATGSSTGQRLKSSKSQLLTLFIAGCFLSALPIIWLSRINFLGQDSFWALVVAILPVQLSYGVIAPCFETLINNSIPESHSQERATILSFGSLIRSVLLIFIAIPAGGSSGKTTPLGWGIPAVLLVVAGLVGSLVLFRNKDNTKDTNLNLAGSL